MSFNTYWLVHSFLRSKFAYNKHEVTTKSVLNLSTKTKHSILGKYDFFLKKCQNFLTHVQYLLLGTVSEKSKEQI